MNIRFHNLGKIKETELDLKPLTVIIGPNNTNKTYLAYSIYGIWQSMGDGNRSSRIPLKQDRKGDYTIKIDALHKAFGTSIGKSLEEFVDELTSFFQDSGRTIFSDTGYGIELLREELELALESIADIPKVTMRSAKFRISLENETIKVSPLESSDNVSANPAVKAIKTHSTLFNASRYLDSALRNELFPTPFLLPAERNAFIITYKVLANRRLKLLLDAQRRIFSGRSEPTKRQLDLLREVGEVRYPQPIEDFLEFLFDVESEVQPITSENDESSRRIRRSSPFERLAEEIEQSIQNGNKINFRSTTLGGKEMMVNIGGDRNIDLYNASSSIKQLAPLLLYLRHSAAKGDLLIIDEPEMNLHPESQAKLLEILSMLVNQGVHVLLTTHSPYLMSHLNNLALTKELTPAIKKRRASSLYLKDPKALLRMDQISAYQMKDNQLVSLKDPDYGIRWDTLSDVSADLQQKYFQVHG